MYFHEINNIQKLEVFTADGRRIIEKISAFSGDHKIDLNNFQSGINNKSKIKVYPNPSYGIFNVYLGNSFKGTNSITIIDSFGKCIFEQKNNREQTITVNISNKEKGVFYLKVQSGTMAKTLKLVLL